MPGPRPGTASFPPTPFMSPTGERAGLSTRISRADGQTMGLAGLWNPWQDKVTGHWVHSFTMLTINADTHPIFRELHRPDPKRPADKQDKRVLVVLNEDAYDGWLDAPPEF